MVKDATAPATALSKLPHAVWANHVAALQLVLRAAPQAAEARFVTMLDSLPEGAVFAHDRLVNLSNGRSGFIATRMEQAHV